MADDPRHSLLKDKHTLEEVDKLDNLEMAAELVITEGERVIAGTPALGNAQSQANASLYLSEGVLISTIMEQLKLIRGDIINSERKVTENLQQDIIDSNRGVTDSLVGLENKMETINGKFAKVGSILGEIDTRVETNTGEIDNIRHELTVIRTDIAKMAATIKTKPTPYTTDGHQVTSLVGPPPTSERVQQKSPLMGRSLLSKVGKSAIMPEFYPRDDIPPTFLEEVDDYFALVEIETDAEKIAVFPFMLHEKAALWFRTIKRAVTSWDNLKLQFINQFHGPYEIERRVRRWENIVLTKHDDIEEFVLDGIRFLPALYPSDKFPEIAERIIRKLPRGMKEHLLSKQKKFEREDFLRMVKTLIRTRDICEDDDKKTGQHFGRYNTYRNNNYYDNNYNYQHNNTQQNPISVTAAPVSRPQPNMANTRQQSFSPNRNKRTQNSTHGNQNPTQTQMRGPGTQSSINMVNAIQPLTPTCVCAQNTNPVNWQNDSCESQDESLHFWNDDKHSDAQALPSVAQKQTHNSIPGN